MTAQQLKQRINDVTDEVHQISLLLDFDDTAVEDIDNAINSLKEAHKKAEKE